MAQVTGNNFTIYAGDDLNNIGCADNCVVNVTAEEIITTTKGSGAFTNREYGRRDATIQATGVEFMYASESAAATANRQDALYFHSYLVQGKKVCAKYEATDGITTKYVIANWIVRRVTFTGQAGNLMTFDIELALDGQLYESSAMQSGAAYDGPSVYIYIATGTVTSFTASITEGASRIYFVTKKTAATGITTILTVITFPSDLTGGANEVLYYPSSGLFEFSESILASDIILISYDPED